MVIVMRTILFRTILAGLAVVAIVTGAAAQDRSALLTSIEVKQLLASDRPNDHAQLRDHFAALADQYAASARRYRAMAQTLTGNPNHPPAVAPGARWTRQAEASESAAAVVRELAAHHERLAAGRLSQAPADSARFEAGEGSPAPTETQLRELAASAQTPAGHRGLAEYFRTVAERQENAFNKYAAFAQLYRAQSRRTGSGDPSVHYDRMARVSRESADEARAEAAKHTQLAQVG